MRLYPNSSQNLTRRMSDSKHGPHAKRSRPSAPERPAKRARPEEAEQKEEVDGNDDSWAEEEVLDVVQRALAISRECVRKITAPGATISAEESAGFTSAVKKLYQWLSGNFVIAERFKINTHAIEEEEAKEGIDDIVDVSEEERHEGASIRMSLMEMLMVTIAQCLRVAHESGGRMKAAGVRFEEACIRARADPRLSTDERLAAIRHRLSREIFTYHHAWRVTIDYKLTAKAAMRKHSELYDFEMTARELEDFYRRNPQYLEERKRLESQPKPYLYRDQIPEADRKANPAIDIVWNLSSDDLMWLCVGKLAEAGMTPRITRELSDFMHAAAWFVFHSNFCSQLWELYPHVPLSIERSQRLQAARRRLIAMVTEQLSFDRDAETLDGCQVVTYRLTAPVGASEYFAGNNEFDVDRHHVKLQKICNWLEPTKQLQEAWLASIVAVAGVAPAEALLRTGELASEVHFYQAFSTLVKFQCRVHLDEHVVFGADVLNRYQTLWKTTDYEIPFRETRPQIIVFGKQCGVRLRQQYHMCTHLWEACLLWLVLIEEHFYGKMSDGQSTRALSTRLGLDLKQAPAPQFLRRRYGGPPPPMAAAAAAIPDPDGGDTDDDGAASPPPRPPVAAAAAAAAAAAPAPVGSLDDID